MIRVTQSLVNGKLGQVKQMTHTQYSAESDGDGCFTSAIPVNRKREVTLYPKWHAFQPSEYHAKGLVSVLRYLHLEHRNPYQSRHTAATLWLASGETRVRRSTDGAHAVRKCC